MPRLDDHGDTPCDHPIKCVNCSGDHPAYSRTCCKWIFEKEVQSVKCKQQVPFVREGFLKREHVVSVFFDLEKAYDTT